jgi:hypothetical protein
LNRQAGRAVRSQTSPVAAFFVFVNNLFFDRVFGTLVNKSRLCPACQSEQPGQARHCSNCGFQQE